MSVGIKARIQFNRFSDYSHKAELHARYMPQEAAERIIESAQKRMGGPKSGRKYKNLPQQSSAPGEAPAIQSETLVNSLDAEPRGFTIVIGSSDPKAVMLEYGTVHMAARPFMTPAVEEVREWWDEESRNLFGTGAR